MRPIKKCRDCGSDFTASKADYTVRCPECRGRKAPASKSTSYSTIECCKCGTSFTSLRCPRCGY